MTKTSLAKKLKTIRSQLDWILDPENFPDVMQAVHDGFELEARMAMAVKIFETKRLSSGMAAQLAGIDRVSFLTRLSQYDVPILDLTLDELESDSANA